ncbi:MAG TPA: hypothetical protein VMG59_03275 [Phycisphaerae bacterium]|nr:hypothetical protein [Phycisphaerae bacterium]
MTKGVNLIEDETTMTEITIQPDGRVYIFGTSRQVLDILVDLDPRSERLRRLLSEVKRYESGRSNGTETAGAAATRRD